MPITFCVIDFETSDLPEKGGEVIEAGYTYVRLSDNGNVSFNGYFSALYKNTPASPIAVAARAQHHISDSLLSGKPPFTAEDALSIIICDSLPLRQVDYIVAHNAAFEKDMLGKYGITPEGRWICTMKAARRLIPGSESYSLQHLRYFLELENGDTYAKCMPPHRAGPDTYLTALLLARLLDYASAEQLADYTDQPTFYSTCPIGKFKNWHWGNIPGDYLKWMTRAVDLDADLRAAAQQELTFRYGTTG